MAGHESFFIHLDQELKGVAFDVRAGDGGVLSLYGLSVDIGSNSVYAIREGEVFSYFEGDLVPAFG